VCNPCAEADGQYRGHVYNETLKAEKVLCVMRKWYSELCCEKCDSVRREGCLPILLILFWSWLQCGRSCYDLTLRRLHFDERRLREVAINLSGERGCSLDWLYRCDTVFTERMACASLEKLVGEVLSSCKCDLCSDLWRICPAFIIWKLSNVWLW